MTNPNKNNKIFISIASYRDKQLVPTVLDCINKAKNPNNLIFGINWQKDDSENISELNKYKNQLRIEESDWRESKGACWARHAIQHNLYDDEPYYLQLDSHHRFLENWDTHLFELLDIAQQTSPKSIIGTYGTTFWPEKNEPLKNEPYRINTFESFGIDGDIISRPVYIKNHKELLKNNQKLIKARLLSGHFIFSEGSFVRECMYDPNFYFRGEEIALSARAYTHGYDFFHPTYTIVWHEYLREKSNKHWLDHVKDNGFIEEGEMRNQKSKKRQRKLFGIDECDIDFKQYGFGKVRSLHDYELYAGLDFKNKKVHKTAHDIRDEYIEPKTLSEAEWQSGMLHEYKFDIEWPLDKVPNKTDYTFWFFGFESKDNKLLYRKDLKEPQYMNKSVNKIQTTIYSEQKPDRCVIIPFSQKDGWMQRIHIDL